MDSQPLPQSKPPVVLREMSIGQILDSAIKLYRANWKKYLAISAMFMIPVLALQSMLINRIAPETEPGIFPGVSPEMTGETPPGMEMQELEGLFLMGMAGAGIFLLITPLVTAAFARTTSSAYLGETESVGGTLQFAASKYWPVLVASVLVFLISMVGFVFLIIPGIILFLRLLLAPIAVVVEGQKGRPALKRSWGLSKGSMGRIFLTLLLAAILTIIVQAILGIPFGLVARALGGGAGRFVDFVGQAVINVIGTPFATIVMVLIYFDLRIRKEAFDLSVMSQEIGQQQA